MVRRLRRSAVSPATRVRAKSGKNWDSPIIPTTKEASATDIVSRAVSYTSHAMMTACDVLARVPQNRPDR